MVNSYVLINPKIKGSFKSMIKSNNSQEAAKTFYKNMSEHFNNNLPKFYFSLQKGKSGKGKIYHFEVREIKKNDDVKFSINSFNMKGENSVNKKLLKKLKMVNSKINQSGGAKKKKSKKKSSKKKSKGNKKSSQKDNYIEDIDDLDDVLTTEMAIVPVMNNPIYYFWYDPFIYQVGSIFIPTFYSYVTPYIEIELNP
tara:strand:+ start:10603 stop:11193 length:591 start_codon:yes stop_codon:yes gene_type:complete